MISTAETWSKGKLISSEEKDDGRPTVEDLEKRLKIIEDTVNKKTKTIKG